MMNYVKAILLIVVYDFLEKQIVGSKHWYWQILWVVLELPVFFLMWHGLAEYFWSLEKKK